MFGLQGWHLLIVIGVIVLLFGATRLPALARSMGQSMKIFRQEIKSDTDDKTDGTEPPVVDDKK
jgi:sec-independent protein translocase protein TatA